MPLPASEMYQSPYGNSRSGQMQPRQPAFALKGLLDNDTTMNRYQEGVRGLANYYKNNTQTPPRYEEGVRGLADYYKNNAQAPAPRADAPDLSYYMRSSF